MRLPELLSNPDAVIEQRRDDSDFRIVTSARAADGKPIIANLKVEGQTATGVAGRIVMTVYGWADAKRGMTNAMRANRLRYVRDEVTARRLGLEGDDPLEISNASVRSGDKTKILTFADIFKEDTKYRRADEEPKAPATRLTETLSTRLVGQHAHRNRQRP